MVKKMPKQEATENADTSTFETFDFEVWPWPYVKVKNAYVITVGYCIAPLYQVWCLWV